MYTVVFKNNQHSLKTIPGIRPGTSLLELALSQDIDLTSLCGGNGTCKCCIVNIEQGGEFIAPPTLEFTTSPGEPVFACQSLLSGNSSGTIVVNIDIAQI